MNYRYYALFAAIIHVELQAIPSIPWDSFSRLFQLQQQPSLQIKEYDENKHFDQVKNIFEQVSPQRTLLHYKPFIDVPNYLEELKKHPLIPDEIKEEEIKNLLQAEKIRKKIVCMRKENPQKVIAFAAYFAKTIPCGVYDPQTKQIYQKDQPMMYIDGIVVDSAEQQKGIGKYLAKYIEGQAKKAKLKTVITDIYPANDKALHVFKRMGYKPIQNSMNIDTIQFVKQLE